MKTSAISPTPRASVTTTPSTSATHPAALMPLSPSPLQTLAISPTTTITTATATATAIQVDLLLMSSPKTGVPAKAGTHLSTSPYRIDGSRLSPGHRKNLPSQPLFAECNNSAT